MKLSTDITGQYTKSFKRVDFKGQHQIVSEQCDFEEFWNDFHQILDFPQNIRARSARNRARAQNVMTIKKLE